MVPNRPPDRGLGVLSGPAGTFGATTNGFCYHGGRFGPDPWYQPSKALATNRERVALSLLAISAVVYSGITNMRPALRPVKAAARCFPNLCAGARR
jgi:hypothetical protein